jgi:hypothetical protein
VTAFLGLLEYPTIGNLMLQQQKTSPKPENGTKKTRKTHKRTKTQHNTTTEAGQEAVCIATGRAFIIIIIIRC